MSNSKNASSSRKKKSKLQRKINAFSKSVGLSPLKIFLSGLLLLGIGFLIYSVAFTDRDINNVAATPSGLKQQQQELSLDQKLVAMMDWRASSKQNFLTTIDEVYEFNDELDAIESKSELSAPQKILVDQIRLRNKSLIVVLMTRNKVLCDNEKADLQQFSSYCLDSADAETKEKARFWLCFVSAVMMADSPSAETLQGFLTAIETHSAGYLKNPQNANMISTLLLNMSKNKPHAKEYWKVGFNGLSRQMATSELDSIQKIGKKLTSLEQFGEFNLPTLSHRILWGDPTGPADLEGVFAALAQKPETDMSNWVMTIKAYESFLSTDKIEETGAAWNRMSELAKNIADPKKREGLEDILARQRTRAMAIGTQFDASGTTMPHGEPINISDQTYTVIIYCDKSKSSFNSMLQLGAETKESQLRYRPILAFENELTQQDIDSLHKVPRDILIAGDETSKKYYDALPIDFFPYVVLLDKTGKIVSVNLDVQQIPTRVAKLDAIERKARAARNSSEDEAIAFPQ